jgi:ABC-type dipeptide/oligopeptide/nickel transport system permease component
MYRYVLKRLLLMIPIILGVSFIIFSILAITPGDRAALFWVRALCRRISISSTSSWATTCPLSSAT